MIFFKQKTAYDMRISDWSSDVGSSDLQPDQIVGVQAWPALHADRVLDATAIFDMGAVELAGTVADPDHVRRGVVPALVVGDRVLAGQRLLLAEQQRLLRGVARKSVGWGKGVSLRIDSGGRCIIENKKKIKR